MKILVFLSFLATVIAWQLGDRAKTELEVRQRFDRKFDGLEHLFKSQDDRYLGILEIMSECVHPNLTTHLKEWYIQAQTSILAKDTLYKRQNGFCKIPETELLLDPLTECANKARNKFPMNVTNDLVNIPADAFYLLCSLSDLFALLQDYDDIKGHRNSIFPKTVTDRLHAFGVEYKTIEKLDTDAEIPIIVAKIFGKYLREFGKYDERTVLIVERMIRASYALNLKIAY